MRLKIVKSRIWLISQISVLVWGLLLTGCSNLVEDNTDRYSHHNGFFGSGQDIVLANARWSGLLTINSTNGEDWKWRMGIDQGGSVRLCEKSVQVECIGLDGHWTIVVPRDLDSSSALGRQWVFNGVACLVVEVIPSPIAESRRDLILIACSEDNQMVLFGFSMSDGLRYLLELNDIDSMVQIPERLLEAPINSVWLRQP
jgi:hypothetical protein